MEMVLCGTFVRCSCYVYRHLIRSVNNNISLSFVMNVLLSDSNKKTTQRSTERTERNVKFAGESREERNNRRNREDKPSSTAPVDFNRFVFVILPYVVFRKYKILKYP